MNTSSRLTARGVTPVAAALVALSQLAASSAGATESSILKDLDIRQVPIAKIAQVTDSSAASSAGGGLMVKTAVDRPDARYRHGESLTLTVDVTEDAYVWVFDTGTSGKVHQIFPNRFEGDNFIRAGNSLAIPREGADYQLLVSHPQGAELLTVIASKNSTPLTQELIDENTQAGPFLALRGDAGSVAKDLSISLKKNHPNWVSHHRVVHIE